MKQSNCNSNDSIRCKKRRNFADILTTKQKRSIRIKNLILIKRCISSRINLWQYLSAQKQKLILLIKFI